MKVPCSNCQGSGRTGRLVVRREPEQVEFAGLLINVVGCVVDRDCSHCAGSGVIDDAEPIYVTPMPHARETPKGCCERNADNMSCDCK